MLREVRDHIGRPGFRTRQITLVTTLLDADDLEFHAATPTAPLPAAAGEPADQERSMTLQDVQKEHIVRVLFDASRLNEDAVASLLRQAGLDLTDRLTLA